MALEQIVVKPVAEGFERIEYIITDPSHGNFFIIGKMKFSNNNTESKVRNVIIEYTPEVGRVVVYLGDIDPKSLSNLLQKPLKKRVKKKLRLIIFHTISSMREIPTNYLMKKIFFQQKK